LLLAVHEEDNAAKFHVNTRGEEGGRHKNEEILYDERPD